MFELRVLLPSALLLEPVVFELRVLLPSALLLLPLSEPVEVPMSTS